MEVASASFQVAALDVAACVISCWWKDEGNVTCDGVRLNVSLTLVVNDSIVLYPELICFTWEKKKKKGKSENEYKFSNYGDSYLSARPQSRCLSLEDSNGVFVTRPDESEV